jgi:hypothetical protein
MSDNLLPCPMCGNRWPWEYVCQSAAVIRCKCGISLKGSEVRTMYRPDEVPLALQPYVSEPDALKAIGYVWVPPTDSFHVLGHTARWNTRSAA